MRSVGLASSQPLQSTSKRNRFAVKRNRLSVGKRLAVHRNRIQSDQWSEMSGSFRHLHTSKMILENDAISDDTWLGAESG